MRISDWSSDVCSSDLSFLGLNGLSEIRNAGVARIRGIELDLGYRQNGFSINAGMSYNDAEIRRDFCAIANDAFVCTLPGADGADHSLLVPKGAALPITPKFQGNIVARYEFPVGDLGAHVQFAGNNIGKRRSDVRTLENGIKGMFDAYTTADISVGVKGEKIGRAHV